MIHIVNGECTARQLSSIAEQRWKEKVWVYSELLTEGPVYARLEQYLAYRALQLERMCGLPSTVFLQRGNEQERSWKSDILPANEIALWFEHDLFDITMLLRLVDRLSQENANAKLYWVDIASIAEHDRYLGFGALTGEQLAPYRDNAILLTAERIEWMRSAWIAYTSPNPLKIAQWVNDASSVSAPFCAIREALQFHLSRYPSVQDGVGIVERITLHAVKDGTASFQQCYDIVRKQLPEYGLGDLQFWGYLRRLTSGDAPLLELSPSSSPLPEPFKSSAANDGQLFVTDRGQQVLNGTLNWAQAGGYGRWLGGAFITRTAVGIK
ncbi:DUF1835 domain-containing protein [Paenibacillus alvei]|uniref:DUF1835 domain-containing protein n=1 Tax=Paenibacillus alvei TaxID=44250 RepID=UPI0018CED404|nr:DUF1835 domain-containing protein [Paenibacillus alvei]MBG9734137.1 DNA-directed RNA polymerase subunit sigma [Paenibacillus alvei]MBG9744502.1 DNA-directed RNA polymerase subunit sigma [Paenibacillus alvei]MCY9582244.1 DUF1835 domain-containing protein [Paenibacillus alvei]MCY9587046.1 DUF1835 domain-containing protein [Paenibacillus alvei]